MQFKEKTVSDDFGAISLYKYIEKLWWYVSRRQQVLPFNKQFYCP